MTMANASFCPLCGEMLAPDDYYDENGMLPPELEHVCPEEKRQRAERAKQMVSIGADLVAQVSMPERKPRRPIGEIDLRGMVRDNPILREFTDDELREELTRRAVE